MVKVKLTAKKRPTTTEAPTTTTETTTTEEITEAEPQCDAPRKLLNDKCRCPRWRKGMRFRRNTNKCRCTKKRRWDSDEKNCVCRDADSVWNEDTEQCEAAPTVAPEPTQAPEPTTTED